MFAAAPTRPRPQKPQVDPKQKSQGKSSTLWILKNGNPESVNVRVGITDGTYAQILNGIDENTQIITGIKTK